MISASHNPPEYNGIKFFDASGTKLSDEIEDRDRGGARRDRASRPDAGRVTPCPIGDGRARYLEHLAERRDASRLDGMRVVVDCANGAASELAPARAPDGSAPRSPIHADPDGKNINDGCGALYPEVVATEVVRLGADAGVSLDGDADRALFADADGAIVDGDQVLAACALALRDRDALTAEHGRDHGDGEPRLPPRDA